MLSPPRLQSTVWPEGKPITVVGGGGPSKRYPKPSTVVAASPGFSWATPLRLLFLSSRWKHVLRELLARFVPSDFSSGPMPRTSSAR